MRELDPKDIDSLVSVKGLIIRNTNIIPDLKQAHFMCTICSYCVNVPIEKGRIDEPVRCTRCDSLNSFSLIHNRSTFSDRQLCVMQETPDSVPDGQTPHTVNLSIYDDLVDVCKPGDK